MKTKPEPLKDKSPYGWVNKYGESVKAYDIKTIKSAVEWLKYYIKQRKKGCDSIKIKSLLIVIDKAFEDVINK